MATSGKQDTWLFYTYFPPVAYFLVAVLEGNEQIDVEI